MNAINAPNIGSLCLDCPPGTTSDKGATSCYKCPAGRYVDKGIWKICENGKYASPDGNTMSLLSCWNIYY